MQETRLLVRYERLQNLEDPSPRAAYRSHRYSCVVQILIRVRYVI